MAEIARKLMEIQGALDVPKGRYNDFGGYDYRSREDILEALKPICSAHGTVVTMTDDIIQMCDGWVYVKSTATLLDVETGDAMSATGWAREQESRPKMDASQLTGTAASYAGKRALGNLFAIDDAQDADALATDSDSEPAKHKLPDGPFVAKCGSCGKLYRFNSGPEFEAWLAQTGGAHDLCACPDWQVDDTWT